MGDPTVVSELEKRSLKLIIGHSEQLIAHLDIQLAYTREGSFSYHLDSALKSVYQSVVLFLQAGIHAYETASPQALEDIQPEIRAVIEEGYSHVDAGRKAALKFQAGITLSNPESDAERRLSDVLFELLDNNVPQAFDIEERMLMEVSEFTRDIVMLSEEELDAVTVKLSLLADELVRLTLERQRRVAEAVR